MAYTVSYHHCHFCKVQTLIIPQYFYLYSLQQKWMFSFWTYIHVYVQCLLSQLYSIYLFFLFLFLTFSHISSVESQKGVTDTVERYSCWEPEGHYCCTKCMVTVFNGASLNNIYALLVLSQLIFLTLCLFSTTPTPMKNEEPIQGCS